MQQGSESTKQPASGSVSDVARNVVSVHFRTRSGKPRWRPGADFRGESLKVFARTPSGRLATGASLSFGRVSASSLRNVPGGRSTRIARNVRNTTDIDRPNERECRGKFERILRCHRSVTLFGSAGQSRSLIRRSRADPKLTCWDAS